LNTAYEDLAEKKDLIGSPANGENLIGSPANGEKIFDFVCRKVLLSVKTLRRILNFKESIFKYGDKEADASPERG
jgi:hypothetical protein